MSIAEPNQPLTELCERAWKLLWRHGIKSSQRGNHLMSHRLGSFRLRSVNRNLWIYKSTDDQPPVVGANAESIFSVDEEGHLGAIDVLECAYALEEFRQATILDDLADLEVEEQ